MVKVLKFHDNVSNHLGRTREKTRILRSGKICHSLQLVRDLDQTGKCKKMCNGFVNIDDIGEIVP